MQGYKEGKGLGRMFMVLAETSRCPVYTIMHLRDKPSLHICTYVDIRVDVCCATVPRERPPPVGIRACQENGGIRQQ